MTSVKLINHSSSTADWNYILIFLILDFSASLSNYLFDWITNLINIDLTIRLFIRITLSAAIYNRS